MPGLLGDILYFSLVMKILYITGMSSAKYGGFEKFNVELLRQGADMVFIYNSIPDSEEYLDDLKEFDAPIYVVYGNILNRAIQSYRIIRKEKPDIVHYHFGFIVYLLFAIIRIFHPKIKQIITQHCEFEEKNFINTIFTKVCYYSLDWVISVSYGVKRKLVETIGNDEHFIVKYLGVAKSEIRNLALRENLNIGNDEIVITSIGFDINCKGFDLLAKAVSNLKNGTDIPKFKIIIIGLDESEEKKLQKIISDLQVQNYFLSVGLRNDVDDFLYFTDIYVQPSRTEAISLSIMEALLYGLPIIGANVGGIPEVCLNYKNGILFEKNNSNELTDAIYCLLSDPQKRIQYGKYSLALSKKFNRKDNASALLAFYSQILGDKQS